jgi:predicted RNase H-like HicB family nuclease
MKPVGKESAVERRVVVHIPVLVERLKGNGYRARGTEPFTVSARGSTREEALSKLRAKIRTRLKEGTELVELEIGPELRPPQDGAGIFSREDPLVQEWIQIMKENRQRMDKDPDPDVL